MKLVSMMFVVALVGTAPALSVASPVTLRFSGTADLSPFGGTLDSVFEGDVTWDETIEPDAFFPSESVARYLLDGSPSSVMATFSIAGIDYSDRIEPSSRFELGSRDLFLQLFFTPPIDLDAGAEPDIGGVWLDLWSDLLVFHDVFPLPEDLSLLARLKHRRFGFSEDGFFADFVLADTLIVPEPTSTTLFMVAIAAAGLSRCRRRFDRSAEG
jgi:hypothetical protein